MVGPDIGYAAGVAGVAVAFAGQWLAARDRRRARPVVITHEDRGRHFLDGRAGQGVSVHLTNESASTAFNIRFGVELGGTVIAWKHAETDDEPSRLNMIEPGGRHPQQTTVIIVIPDLAILGISGEPDTGRAYWAYYQSPAGDWWYTRNPSRRSEDLIVRRVRSRRWNAWSRGNRDLSRRVLAGKQVWSDAVRELPEGAQTTGRENDLPPNDDAERSG